MGQCNNTQSRQTPRHSIPPVCEHPAPQSNQEDAVIVCDNNEYENDDDCTTDDHGTCVVEIRTSTAHEPVLDTCGLQAHYRTRDDEDSESDEDGIEGAPASDDSLGNGTPPEPPSRVPTLDVNSTDSFFVRPVTRVRVSRNAADLALLDLARLLDAARCPHYMFDSILAWCKYAGSVGCNPSVDKLPSRRAYFAKLEKRLSAVAIDIPQYQTSHVEIETADIKGDNRLIKSEICTWSFEEQLISLLSDHSIFGNMNNLNVNPENPFLPMTSYSQSGGWYQDTITAKNITGVDGNFLCGIVLASDRTGNTWNQKFGTEPLLFTLSIIKESLWHDPKVWRVLAMIPCDKDYQGQAAGNVHGSRKMGEGYTSRNFHKYLQVALESLKRVQSMTHRYWPYNENGDIPPNAKTMYRTARGIPEDLDVLCKGESTLTNLPPSLLNGVRTTLVLGGYQKHMNIVCCISHLILDGEGADKFTCRHKSTTRTHNRITRGCDCTFAECDDTFVNCLSVSQAMIVETYFQTKWSDTYMDKPDGSFQKQMVDSCAVHACQNALWCLDFGYQPNGFYLGALPVDSLHAFEEGNNHRVLTLILGEQTTSHKFCADVDNLVDERLRRGAPKQGVRKRFPRVTYSRGITSLSHLAANERVGVMFALTLVAISSNRKKNAYIILGRNIPNGDIEERTLAVQERLIFCQLSLLYHCWVDNGPHEILFVGNRGHRSEKAIKNQEAIRETIAQIGEMQKIVFSRQKGHGYNTPKFHDWFVHMLSALVSAGNGRRVKTDVSEKQHKYFCKAPGTTALKRTQEIFLRGVCDRLTTTSVLNRTRSLFQLDDLEKDEHFVPQQSKHTTGFFKNKGVAAFVQMSDSAASSKIFWNESKANRVGYHPFVHDMILHGCHKLRDANLITADRIPIYTEMKEGETIFRCHPNFRKDVGAWFDWVMIKWDATMNKEWKVASTLWKPQAINAAQDKEVLLSLHEHLDDAEPFDTDKRPANNEDITLYVPARILAFVEGCSTGEDGQAPIMYALVQSCEYTCHTDSIITRRWRKTCDRPQKAVEYVEVDSIACSCYVVEAEPGFYIDNDQAGRHDFHVHEVFDRKTSWGKKFLEVVDRGLTTLCPKDLKAQLDQITKDRKGVPGDACLAIEDAERKKSRKRNKTTERESTDGRLAGTKQKKTRK